MLMLIQWLVRLTCPHHRYYLRERDPRTHKLRYVCRRCGRILPAAPPNPMKVVRAYTPPAVGGPDAA